MRHRPVGNNAVGCSSRADAVIFAEYTAAMIHNAFQWTGQPQKLAQSPWDSWTPFNTCFRGPTRIYRLIGISIGSAVFEGLTKVINRQTDTPTHTHTHTDRSR